MPAKHFTDSAFNAVVTPLNTLFLRLHFSLQDFQLYYDVASKAKNLPPSSKLERNRNEPIFSALPEYFHACRKLAFVKPEDEGRVKQIKLEMMDGLSLSNLVTPVKATLHDVARQLQSHISPFALLALTEQGYAGGLSEEEEEDEVEDEANHCAVFASPDCNNRMVSGVKTSQLLRQVMSDVGATRTQLIAESYSVFPCQVIPEESASENSSTEALKFSSILDPRRGSNIAGKTCGRCARETIAKEHRSASPFCLSFHLP